jgi:hypothetical protein
MCFIHSSVDGHLGWFHSLVILNSVAINMGSQVTLLYSDLIPTHTHTHTHTHTLTHSKNEIISFVLPFNNYLCLMRKEQNENLKEEWAISVGVLPCQEGAREIIDITQWNLMVLSEGTSICWGSFWLKVRVSQEISVQDTVSNPTAQEARGR